MGLHRADLMLENEQTKENQAHRKALNSLLMGGSEGGGINPDLTQFGVGVPEKPQFDNQQADQFKNLSKAAAVAQGIDAMVQAFGFARTHGQQNEMRPTPSPVGELGIHSYNNLMGMEQAHRDQLNNWRDNVLDANKHNAELGIRTAENQMSLNKGVIENELKHLREMEKQGEITKRELERQSGMLRRQLLQIGYDLDDKGNITELTEGEAGDSGFTPQQDAMFKSYLKYDQDASPEDYGMDGKARPGTPSWHRERLIDKLGDDFYLMLNQHQDSQAEEGAYRFDPDTDPTTQRNLRASNQTQQQMLIHNIINASDPQTRQQAAQNWYAMTVKELEKRGDVKPEEIPQLAEELFARHLQQQLQGGQQPQQGDTQSQQQIAGMGQDKEKQETPEDQQSQQKSDADKLRQNTTAGAAVRRINQAINNIHGIQNTTEQFPDFQQDLARRRLREKQQEIRRIAKVISGYPKEQRDLVLRNITDRELYDQIVNEMD